ncbi:MAG: sigma-70 family RNA polymerase sigma factor [Oscillospiraceae bacterium]|nr:sigma-70 family RNA polymerase sigma factor [Oscillospiraceae bacterium]
MNELQPENPYEGDEIPADGAGEDAFCDSLQIYLEEIGRIPLLTQEEETLLAAKVMAGDSDAKSRLIEANLRLVVSVAKGFRGQRMEFADLIQAGNLGLMNAADKFDPARGTRFSTYATWWIRHSIVRCIVTQSRTIRIPEHLFESVDKILRTSRRLMETLGRDPTEAELAEALNMTVENVRKLLLLAREPLSLDAPGGDEEDDPLANIIPAETGDPAELTEARMMARQVRELLPALTPQERQVLDLRYGLRDGRPRSLESVGKEFRLTRERIRQIENKALQKLKALLDA